MMRMVRECEPSQRRLAAFLVVVVVVEVTLICSIIRHEHVHARGDLLNNLTSTSGKRAPGVYGAATTTKGSILLKVH